MKPKTEIFFDAITLLREDIVEEAQDYRFRKKQAVWKKFGSLAACLVLIASISLLMLPRGCGSSGGNADMNNSSAPMATADSSAPAGEPAAGAPASGDPAPGPSEAPAGGPEYGQAGQVQFAATVIEIDEDSILVEPLEGENIRNSYDRIMVVTKNLELPELAVGDKVLIACDGWIQESDPARITGAAAIERIEED